MGNGFSINVSKLVLGGVAAEVIGFAFYPVISRMYNPADFGVYSSVFAISSAISVASTLGFDKAVVLPDSEEEAGRLVYLGILSSVLVAMLSLCFVVISNSFFASFMGLEGYSWYLLFIPVNVLFYGARSALLSLHNRDKEYWSLANSRLLMSVCTVSIRVVSGFAFGSSAFWLLLSSAMGFLAGNANCFYRWFSGTMARGFLDAKLYKTGYAFKDFLIYSSSTSVIHEVTQLLPVVFLSRYYGLDAVGYYGLAFNVLYRPIGLLSNSISLVFLQNIAVLGLSKKKINKEYLRVLFFLSLASLPFYFLFYYLADDLFLVLFGDGWVGAGVIASILTPWLYTYFLMPMAVQVFVVKRVMRINFVLHLVVALSRLSVLSFACFLVGTAEGALEIFSWANCVLNVLYLVMAYRV